jgi:predicted dehydrogenase
MTTVTAPIRIGLIGAGGIARAHVEGYERNAELVKLVAVADISREGAEARAGDTGAAIYADYRDLLADPNVDAVDICLPHHLHYDAILAAAAAGKHILCEKPLCLNPDEARGIQDAVKSSGVTLMCAHQQLFMPTVARARELLHSGVLGEVYEVRTTDSFYNDFKPENMGWRASVKTNGGGELIDTGYHPSYLLMHLAGAVPTEVMAMLSTHRLKFMEAEDSAQLLVRFGNGAVGHLVTSWAYVPAAGTERFSAVAEKGWLTSDGTTLIWGLRGEEPVVEEFEPVHQFAAEIEHFARCLIDGTRPLHTEVEGVAVLGIILAAYQSAREGAIAPVLSL